MSNSRQRRIEEIEKRLGTRSLIWFGTRGSDSQALLQIRQFREVFSIIAPLGSLSIPCEVCLENMKRIRVDLDRYSIDYDSSPEAQDLIRRLFSSLTKPTVVAMYRPSRFFTSIYYPRCDFVEYLGQFQERQAPFEHKPWVESELRKRGVRVVPWRYLGDTERARLEEILEQGPVVLRASRSDGGLGLSLITKLEDFSALSPAHADNFIGAAPYLYPNIPLNVNACVFQDGSVSLHSPSLQLIGLEGFTGRTFGYCGNDFAKVRDLDSNVLDQLEEIVVRSGRWLARMGYLGAFGVDALLYEGDVYLTEINPRFQGSSHLSSRLDMDLDRADMFLEHIAAFLGLPPSEKPMRHLRELASEQHRVSQVVCHNFYPYSMRRNCKSVVDTDFFTCQLLPKSNVAIDPEAILLRAVILDSVTQDGTSICEGYRSRLSGLLEGLFDPISLVSCVEA